MQRIVIKNFGAVKDADIELKKITVLIGEQASGKSTIAKLVYYFKTLKNDFFREVYNENGENKLYLSDLNRLCENKFYNLFGSVIYLPKFEIYYYFNKEKYVRLALSNEKRLQIFFSYEMKIDEFVSSLNEIKKHLYSNSISKSELEKLLFDKEKENSVKEFFFILSKMFESNQFNHLYVIAGRNATVSYSELFEKYLFADLQNKLIENSKLPFSEKRYNVDETLMLEFIERMTTLKTKFKAFTNFERVAEAYLDKRNELNIVVNRINKIIKGKYKLDSNGEKIVYDNKDNDYVLLSNSSSGQQEVIRILQDILISIAEKSKVFRIIEEPEAHLFPSAQKQLIELLTFLIN